MLTLTVDNVDYRSAYLHPGLCPAEQYWIQYSILAHLLTLLHLQHCWLRHERVQQHYLGAGPIALRGRRASDETCTPGLSRHSFIILNIPMGRRVLAEFGESVNVLHRQR